jgi:DNA polymerase-3 subunit gamma/tau
MTVTPCGVCPSCTAIAEDRHLDVLEMDAASRTGVDDIREIIDSTRYKAVMGRFKVFIIDEVHMLSKSAFNALLKTLEEPPTHVKFIFATTEIRKIPDTILSRCMRFDLKRMDISTLCNQLHKICGLECFTLEDEAGRAIARAADGSMRDALSMLDQAMALAQVESQNHISSGLVATMLGLASKGGLFELIHALFRGEIPQAISVVRQLLSQGGDPTLIMQDVLDMLYGLICLKTTPRLMPEHHFSQADLEQAHTVIHGLTPSVLMRAWQMLLHGYREVQQAHQPTQALEMVLIRLCYIKDLPTPGELLNRSSEGPLPTQVVASSPASAAPLKTAPSPTLPASAESAKSTPMDQAHVADVPKAAASIHTLQDIVSLLNHHREALLASHVMHDVHCISLKEPNLIIRLKPTAPKNLAATLQDALGRITRSPWKVTLSQEQGTKTIVEANALEQQQKEDALRAHPLVQTILSHYPTSQLVMHPQEITP